MEINHFSHEHALVSSEEREQKDFDNFFCKVCGEPIFGLSYCCRLCPYVLHKWCAELPRELSITPDLHPKMLPDHKTLILSRTKYSCNPSLCKLCNYPIKPRIFAYTTTKKGSSAKFHVECASFSVKQLIRWDIVLPGWMAAKYCSICQIKDDCPKLRFEEPGVGKFYHHIHCEMLPRKVKHSVHLHELTIHPPIIESDFYFEFFCDACEKDRDLASPVYYCEPCKFIAHIGCGVLGSEPPPIQNILGSHPQYCPILAESEKEEVKEEETKEGDVLYGKGDKIDHPFHQHPLALTYYEKLYWLRQEKCWACGQSIFGIAYACIEESCDFYLHKRCAQLPKATSCSVHQHHGPLKLRSSFKDSNPLCEFCGMYIGNIHYGCKICDFQIHALCALLPDDLNHQSHEHTLTAGIFGAVVHREGDILKLPIGTSKNPLCQACGFHTEFVALECKSCNFHLHVHCFLLPYVGKHTTHKHELNLTYSYKEDPTALEYICDTCEKQRTPNRWLYCCPEPKCYIVSHVDCVVTNYFTALLSPLLDDPVLALNPTLSKNNPAHKITLLEDRSNHKPPLENSSKDQAPSTSEPALTQTGPQDNIHSELDLLRVLFPDLLKAPAPEDASTSTVVEETDLDAIKTFISTITPN